MKELRAVATSYLYFRVGRPCEDDDDPQLWGDVVLGVRRAGAALRYPTGWGALRVSDELQEGLLLSANAPPGSRR